MGQEILTEAHQKVIAAVAAEPRLADFYLSGGTALAHYYLRHRLSDDLDFFTAKEIDAIFIHEFSNILAQKLGAEKVQFEKLYDRYLFFYQLGSAEEELKVEFTRYPFSALSEHRRQDGIAVDSLRDISANKLMALLDRFDPKDFVDLYFILKKRGLVELKKDVEKKFGIIISPLFLGSELAKVRRVESLPRMVQSLSITELKDFFSEQAKKFPPDFIE